MRHGGRSGPRARRTSTRQVPEPRSCPTGPHSVLRPSCSSLWSPSRRQPSSAATHVSNGMSTIRRNGSPPGPEPGPIPALRPSPRLDIGSRSTATGKILTFTSLRLSGHRVASATCARRTRTVLPDGRPAGRNARRFPRTPGNRRARRRAAPSKTVASCPPFSRESRHPWRDPHSNGALARVRVRCGTCAARVESLRARVLAQARQVICQPDLVLARPSVVPCREHHRVRPGTLTAVITISGIRARGGGVRPSLRPGVAVAALVRRALDGGVGPRPDVQPVRAAVSRLKPRASCWFTQPGPETPRHPSWLDPVGCRRASATFRAAQHAHPPATPPAGLGTLAMRGCRAGDLSIQDH